MTFSIPQEEQSCNYSNQNRVCDKEPGNLPVSLHTSMINIDKDQHEGGAASQWQVVFSTSASKQRQSQHV